MRFPFINLLALSMLAPLHVYGVNGGTAAGAFNNRVGLGPGAAAALERVTSISPEELASARTAHDVLYSQVVDRFYRPMGTITNLLIDNGRLTQAYVEVGAVFSIGGETVRVPFEAFSRAERADERVYRLDVVGNDFTRAIEEGAETLEISEDWWAVQVPDDELVVRETVENAIGRPVLDREGQPLGVILDLTLRDQQVVHAVLRLRERIGTTEDLVRIPFESLEAATTGHPRYYQVNVMRSNFVESIDRARAGETTLAD